MPVGQEEIAKSQQRTDWTSTVIFGISAIASGSLLAAGVLTAAPAAAVLGIGITAAAGYEIWKKTVETKAAINEKQAREKKRM